MSESLKWVKSTYSAQGNCVEATTAEHVLIRDSQDNTGPVLKVSRAGWRELIDRVKTGVRGV